MYIKNQLKKRLMISIATVMVLVITIIGSSYALFMDVKTDVNTQVLTVGNLQITYIDGVTINVDGIQPMSNATAYTKLDNYYEFTVDNIGDIPYNFTVSLKDKGGYSGVTLLNHNYIKYDFNNTGAKTLGAAENGVIFEGVLEPHQARLYSVRIWVGEAVENNLPNSALNSEIHLDIVIDGRAGTE